MLGAGAETTAIVAAGAAPPPPFVTLNSKGVTIELEPEHVELIKVLLSVVRKGGAAPLPIVPVRLLQEPGRS